MYTPCDRFSTCRRLRSADIFVFLFLSEIKGRCVGGLDLPLPLRRPGPPRAEEPGREAQNTDRPSTGFLSGEGSQPARGQRTVEAPKKSPTCGSAGRGRDPFASCPLWRRAPTPIVHDRKVRNERSDPVSRNRASICVKVERWIHASRSRWALDRLLPRLVRVEHDLERSAVSPRGGLDLRPDAPPPGEARPSGSSDVGDGRGAVEWL